MAGKPWTAERKAAEAARRAGEQAQKIQAEMAEGRQTEAPVLEPQAPDENDPGRRGGVKTRNDPRNQAMEELVKQREEAQKQESQEEQRASEVPGASQEPAAQAAETSDAPSAEPAPAVAADASQQAQQAQQATEAPKTVKVKVDGEELDVPAEEVEAAGGVRAYQTNKAAENRLKKANDAVAEAKRLQAGIVQWAQQQIQANPPKPQQSDQQFLAERVEMIRMGTPEQATAALQEILARSAAASDPNRTRMQAVMDVRRTAAAEQFKKEFQDIASTPLLMKMAANMENEWLQGLDQNVINSQQFALGFDFAAMYRNIGNQIRGALPRPSQPSAPAAQAAPAPAAATPSSTPSTPADKEARKSSIVVLPTAAARAELPKEDKPESREETLEAMRKARGQKY